MGKGFAYPKRLTNCLLVAEGHGAASLYFLAQELIARHKRVDMIVGGESLERVFKPIEGKRLSQTIQIVTADGSLGERGSVMDALPEMVEKCGAQVMYAAASTQDAGAHRRASVASGRSRRRSRSRSAWHAGTASASRAWCPVARKDGSGYDNLRSCIDGPVFNPARVLWDRWLSDAPTMLPTPPEGLPVVRSWPG